MEWKRKRRPFIKVSYIFVLVSEQISKRGICWDKSNGFAAVPNIPNPEKVGALLPISYFMAPIVPAISAIKSEYDSRESGGGADF